MHAFAKMPHYMLRFGSANNFSGQIGERALKAIVKITQQERNDAHPPLRNNVLYANLKIMLSNML
jgi:hypothetical protein